jgi:hypothetical protein
MLDTRLHLNSALIRTSGKGLEILELSDKFSVEHRGASNSKVLTTFFFKIIQGLNSFEVYTVYGRSDIPYILESNPHPFCSFRGLKNQMRIRIAVESRIL